MERAALAREIVRRVRLSGRFTLRSGRTSTVYWDKYRFESDPRLLAAIVAHLRPLLPPDLDSLAGLELGGVPLATGLSLATGHPCRFVRKAAKPHGTGQLVEGGWTAGERAVVIEDVMTSGGQVAQSIEQMRALGLVVTHAVCVIDRQEGARERLTALGCHMTALFTMADLTIHADD
jgi:orotate phosphoribosyltransferase